MRQKKKSVKNLYKINFIVRNRYVTVRRMINRESWYKIISFQYLEMSLMPRENNFKYDDAVK